MVMKRIPQSLFLALFVFAVSSFAQTQPQQTAQEEFWKEFSSTAGRFKVALPGNPTETSETIELTLALGKVKRHTFAFWFGFATFLVSYSDLPVTLADPDEVDEFLNHHIHEGEVAATQGKLLSKTEIELDGYPGRELIVETPKSTFRMKRYLVGRRFYQITVSTLTAGFLAADIRRHANDLEKQGKKDLAKITRENANNAAELARSMVLIADKFFASFKLTGKPVVGEKTTPETKVVAVDEKGNVEPGSALTKVAPAYPPEAKEAGVSGKVQVQVTISEEGRVIEAMAISGPELLREAAVQAAKQWVFKPTRLDGAPVKVQGILTFNFEL
jgi:TonB family protein